MHSGPVVSDVLHIKKSLDLIVKKMDVDVVITHFFVKFWFEALRKVFSPSPSWLFVY